MGTGNALATAMRNTDKLEKVMHEFKLHKLQSPSGAKVDNPKQAVAIAISEQKRHDEGKL